MGLGPDLCAQTGAGRPTGTGRPAAREGPVVRYLSDVWRFGSVEVAPDLKTCKAWISVLGDEKAIADTLEGLKSAEGYIKSKLAREINLRNTPEIRFVMDQSIAYGVSMSKKIDEVTKDLKEERQKEDDL